MISEVILQSTMSSPIILHTKIQVVSVIIQTVKMCFPKLTNIHDNYQKNISPFVYIELSRAFHHALKVAHVALEYSLC